MENKFRQPDLFLVMSEEEMDGALSYAEELIGENEKRIEMYLNFSLVNNTGQYRLLINDVDVREYILDENNNFRFEFPMMPYYCLIFFESDGKRDCIALAIPVSIWPEAYDIEYIKSLFAKHNFEVYDCIPKYFLNEEFFSTIRLEAEQAKDRPIDSPWTVRDKDTLEGALLPGGDASTISDLNEVQSILLVRNTNVTLDFNATVVVPPIMFDTVKINYSTFRFPNSIVVYTKDGKKTPIYVGDDVSYEDIINILKGNGLSGLTTIKDLNDFLDNMDELIIEIMPFARFKGDKKREV